MSITRFDHKFSSQATYIYKCAQGFNHPFTVDELKVQLKQQGFVYDSDMRNTIAKLCNRGKWIRVSRGVYRVAGLIKQLPTTKPKESNP